MSLRAAKAEMVFRFGNIAFPTLNDWRPNDLFELIFIFVCLFFTDTIILLYNLELFFMFIAVLIKTRLTETFLLIYKFAIQSCFLKQYYLIHIRLLVFFILEAELLMWNYRYASRLNLIAVGSGWPLWVRKKIRPKIFFVAKITTRFHAKTGNTR